MSLSSGKPVDSGLAQFACDHCRRKKLKCSKELPKCSACRPWSSSCDYAREDASTRARKASKRNEAAAPASNSPSTNEVESTANSNNQREAACVEPIKRTPSAGLPPIGNVAQGAKASTKTSRAAYKHSMPDGKASQLAASFSFLHEATRDVTRASSTFHSPAHENARSELQTLQKSLALNAEGISGVEHAGKAYHVPTRAAGYAYISQFVGASSMGSIFLQEPTDECLRQVIFTPVVVKEKAWIVFVNYMLLGMISTKPGQEESARRLRSNVHLALNDSSIFLSPSVVNIQALATLAIHGEDFASPSQSWMLVGHACRQVEALALHRSPQDDSDEEKRRLCLFWLVFLMDKGCSLAFGRPPTLSTARYSHVPRPDYEFLARHCPHMSEMFGGDTQSQRSDFGALYFLSGFELSKLIGTVLESGFGADSAAEKENFRERVDDWYRVSNTELSAAITAEASTSTSTPAQQRQMTLGIRSMKFQYLHLLIMFCRDHPKDSTLRIGSAREALSILPELVANWESVYNGIVWQMLYLPFSPFFVVFGEILSDPAAWTVNNDLRHLRDTVAYFESMRAELSLLATLATRLAHTAGVFVQLAQQHVDGAKGSQQAAAVAPTNEPLDFNDADIQAYLNCLPAGFPSATGITNLERLAAAADDTTGKYEAKRPFDDVFDWFSWDSYYSGIGI